MSITEESGLSAPRLALFITRVEDGKRLEEIFDELSMPLSFQCRVKGTAPSEILDIFGLGGTTRLLTVGILFKCATKDLFKKTGQRISFYKRGGGIVLTIPITGIQSPLFDLLNDEKRAILIERIEERIGRDMSEIHEKSGYNVIWVSVEAGYSDQVVDAARAVGAKGGTILRGRRRNFEQTVQRFGVPVQDEQDFVMIVAPRKNKSEIMKAISRSCGLHTPAHGVVLSLPVDDAIGLEE